MRFLIPLLACLSSCFGQVGDVPSAGISEIVDNDGWAIPGLDSQSVKVKGARTKEQGIPDGVRVDIIEPSSRGVFHLIFPVADHPNRVELRKETVEVTQIRRYTIDGRPFLCVVTANVIGSLRPDAIHAGGLWKLQFYDPNGQGRLTVLRYLSEVPEVLVVPDWVRAKH